MKTHTNFRSNLALTPEPEASSAPHFAYFVTNSEGFITEANEQFINLLGYTRRELTGKYFVRLLPQNRQAAAAAAHDAFVAGRDEDTTLQTFIGKNGQPVYLYLESHRTTDANGELAKMTLVESRMSLAQPVALPAEHRRVA